MRKYYDILKQKNLRYVMPLNIQLFAEDGDGGTGDGAGTKGEDSGATEQIRTFDEIMSDRDYQSEFDRRVQKALNTAKRKGRRLWIIRLVKLIKLGR